MSGNIGKDGEAMGMRWHTKEDTEALGSVISTQKMLTEWAEALEGMVKILRNTLRKHGKSTDRKKYYCNKKYEGDDMWDRVVET